ncbi:GA-stimulated transcript-like protein 7 [Striga asiatica]|uniref:GA-stimulated transcript-like protein 7 n=1 Tax=Striga asiatica TaxID=4170 RepID=A0A5A7NZN0_STRAF|nr:GA-stimulated transcript-like protein 7 [Striga asiatica]
MSSLKIFTLCFLLMILLLIKTHAAVITFSPAPQPQLPISTFPMYGATPGSLRPQEAKCYSIKIEPHINQDGIILLDFSQKNVGPGAREGARKPRSRSHVCFSAKNAVPNAFVFLQELMATNSFALATTIGRPKGVDQNALETIGPIARMWKTTLAGGICFGIFFHILLGLFRISFQMLLLIGSRSKPNIFALVVVKNQKTADGLVLTILPLPAPEFCCLGSDFSTLTRETCRGGLSPAPPAVVAAAADWWRGNKKSVGKNLY